jgi:putative MATE family efflux protein
MITDLTQGSVLKRLLVFAYPLALSNLLQVVYSIVDMIVIGRFIGSTGLSGAAIGSDLLNFFMMLGAGFSNAGQVMISQYVGRGDRKGINSVIGTMFTFILGVSLILTVIALIFARDFLMLVKAPAESFVQAYNFAVTGFCGLFFIYGYNAVSSILRGMGDSKRPFIFIIISTVTNAILALTFVGVLRLNTFGAALATVISQALSFTLSIIYLYKKREAFGFDFKPKSFRISRQQLGPMVGLGLPMALQNAAISLSFLFVNSCINSYGVIASAVTGVGSKLSNVMGIIAQAAGMASSTMIGQNFGAAKFDRCKKIVHYTLFICLAACAILIVLYNLLPRELFSLFSDDPEVLNYAPVYVLIMSAGFIAFAVMSPYISMINGIGFASFCFLVAIFDGVISRVGLALLLGRVLDMGITGFWLGNSLAAFTTAIIAGIYFYTGAWKKRSLLVK